MNNPLPWKNPGSVAQLEATLAKRIMIIDGAMGTMIQQHELHEADFRGERFKLGFDSRSDTAISHDLKSGCAGDSILMKIPATRK